MVFVNVGLDHRFGHLLAHPDLQLSQLVGKVCDFMNPTKILSRLAQTMIKAFYPILNPNTGEGVWPDRSAVWAYSRELHKEHTENNLLYWGKDGTSKKPRFKKFLTEAKSVVPRSIWPYSEVGHTQSATKSIRSILPEARFETPKPLELIERMLHIGSSEKDDIILDFFAGSGSTGHATFRANIDNEEKRQFILIQLPEPTNQQEFPTISEITKERLRRAGKKIKEENPLFAGDTGFRVFKLDTSNICPWQPDRNDLEGTLLANVEHLVEGRSEQDILFELLLKLGLDLTVPMEQRAFAGKTVHSIGLGALMVCLAEEIKRAEVEPLADGILAWWRKLAPAVPVQFVFRDSGFVDDVAKTNLAAILEQNIPSDQLAGIRSL